MKNLSLASKRLKITGYALLGIALLVRSWIPVLLLVIIALLVEWRKTVSRDGC